MLENVNGWEALLFLAVLIAMVFAALYGVFYLVIRAAIRREKANTTDRTTRTKRPR